MIIAVHRITKNEGQSPQKPITNLPEAVVAFQINKIRTFLKGIFEDIPQKISTNWKIVDTENRPQSLTECIILRQGEFRSMWR